MKKFILLCLFTNTILLPAETYVKQAKDTIKPAVSYLMNNKKKVAKNVGKELLEDGKIIGGVMLAAIAYGVMSNQIAARVCPKYFIEGFRKKPLNDIRYYHERPEEVKNIWLMNAYKDKTPTLKEMLGTHSALHAKIWLADYMLKTKNPTILGLYWGIVDWWKLGALLSISVTLAARAGKWPKIAAKDLIKPIGIGLAALGALAATVGGIGYVSPKYLPPALYYRIDKESGFDASSYKYMDRYTASYFAHQVGYFGGAVAGAGLIGWMLYKRYLSAQEEQKVKTKTW